MLRVCLLLVFIDISFGCSCGLPYLQDLYCDNDLVIHVKAIARAGDDYDIEVLKAYKVPDDLFLEEGSVLEGKAESSLLCPVNIKVGQTFLLARRGSGTNIAFHLCDAIPSRILTPFNEKSMSDGYDCRCNMRQCGLGLFSSFGCNIGDVRCDQNDAGECQVVRGEC